MNKSNNFQTDKSSRLIRDFERETDLSEHLQAQIESLENLPNLNERLLVHKLRLKMDIDRTRLKIAKQLLERGIDVTKDFRGAAA